MKEHYYVEFIINTLQTSVTRIELTSEYLNKLYNNNEKEDKRSLFAIPLKWYLENDKREAPRYLTPDYNISDEFLLEGVRLAKIEELNVICKDLAINSSIYDNTLSKIKLLNLKELYNFDIIREIVKLGKKIKKPEV